MKRAPATDDAVPELWQPSRKIERGNAAEQIFDDLKGHIVSGRVARGAKLPTEKQLADDYNVSGATVREAIRGLTTARLVEVRHGSGSYVTAKTDELVAISLHSMIQMERIGVADILGVLGMMNAHAAELAASRAGAKDIERMQRALDATASGTSAMEISEALAEFLTALVEASGNPLLATLSRMLIRIHIGLARELSGMSFESWQKTTARLAKDRQRLLDAIRDKDPVRAYASSRAYHKRSLKVIPELPAAGAAEMNDPALANLLAALLQRAAV
ncbi:MAG: GntR family transcriptional regulator [Pseudomonadota bacterium]